MPDCWVAALAIQSTKSTTAANHLKNGFWAKTKADEKSAGFSVSFLVKIVDITDDVLEGIDDNTNDVMRKTLIGKILFH